MNLIKLHNGINASALSYALWILCETEKFKRIILIFWIVSIKNPGLNNKVRWFFCLKTLKLLPIKNQPLP